MESDEQEEFRDARQELIDLEELNKHPAFARFLRMIDKERRQAREKCCNPNLPDSVSLAHRPAVEILGNLLKWPEEETAALRAQVQNMKQG